MKSENAKARQAINVLFLIVAIAIIVGTVYIGGTPRQYDLEVGDVSAYDIAAPRDIADEAETERRALVEMSLVPNIMIRSEARSEESRDKVSQLIKIGRAHV